MIRAKRKKKEGRLKMLRRWKNDSSLCYKQEASLNCPNTKLSLNMKAKREPLIVLALMRCLHFWTLFVLSTIVYNTLTWLLLVWFHFYENGSIYLYTTTPHYQNSSGVCNAMLVHFCSRKGKLYVQQQTSAWCIPSSLQELRKVIKMILGGEQMSYTLPKCAVSLFCSKIVTWVLPKASSMNKISFNASSTMHHTSTSSLLLHIFKCYLHCDHRNVLESYGQYDS